MKFAIFLIASLLSISSFACDRGSDYLCRGDRVIDSDNDEAQVIAVWKDGTVSLRLANNSSVTYKRHIDTLAITEGCSGKYKCVGDRVIDSDNDVAIIRGIFKNGSLSLRLESNSSVKYRRLARQVAVTRGCLKREDICVGDIVVDSDNDEAIVQGIFQESSVLSLRLRTHSSVKYSRYAQSVALIDDCSPWRR